MHVRPCGVWDLQAEGAAGNGTTDDGPLIQSILDSASPGETVRFCPGRTYLSNQTLFVRKPLHIHAEGARIRTTVDTVHQFEVQASDVTFRGGRLSGATGTVLRSQGGTGIWAVAPDWNSPIRRLRVFDVAIDNQPWAGVWGKFHHDHVMERVHVADFVYAGLAFSSAWGARNVGCSGKRAKGQSNSAGTAWIGYGVFYSRDNTATIGASPKSRDVLINDFTAEDIPWEGIDTHGNQGMKVTNCTVRRCLVGISCVPSPDPAGADIWSPNDMQILNNLVDGEVNDGSTQAGIKVVGADQVGPDENDQGAYGAIVRGNVIRRMGHGAGDSNTVGGGILCYHTRGAIIADNTIIEPSHHGISMWNNNLDALIEHNVIVDPWSDVSDDCAAVAFRSVNNTWTLTGNRLAVTGRKTAPFVARVGQWVVSTTGSSWLNGGGNDFTAAAVPYQGGQGIQRMGFYTAPPAPRPTVAAGASTDQLAAAIRGQGVIS